MNLRLAVVSLLCCILPALAAGPAGAAEIVTRDAQNVRLATDNQGRALVTYSQGGRMWHVFYSGAINARQPSRVDPQVKFKVDYSGGRGQWKTFKNTCRSYDGPKLAFFLTGCKASDGSYWALQVWQRLLPNVGYVPWTSAQKVREVRISHWRGPLAQLDALQVLDQRTPKPGDLRSRELPRPAGLRLPHDKLGRPARRLRPAHLPRHARLRVRLRLEPRDLVRHAQGERHVLLRVLPVLDVPRLSAPALRRARRHREALSPHAQPGRASRRTSPSTSKGCRDTTPAIRRSSTSRRR